MRRYVALVLVLAATLPSSGTAQRSHGTSAPTPTPPDSWELPATGMEFGRAVQTAPAGAISWMAMQCSGDAPRYMHVHCVFRTVAVRVPTASAIDEAVREVREHSFQASELATLRRMCAAPRSEVPGRERDASESMCACLSRDAAERVGCVLDVIAEWERTRVSACEVGTQSFEVDLERVGRTRWSGTATGVLCANVTAVIVDSDDEYLRWTYTQTRVAVDDSSELCGGFEVGAVQRFDTRGPSILEAPLPCSTFAIGAFL